jgi:hypothetical protein
LEPANFINEEIYLGDDDICGFFRHGKYNPQLVAMHGFVLQTTFMHTSQTFGDWCPHSELHGTSEKAAVVPLVQPNTVQKKPYLPEITLSPSPAQEESATFKPVQTRNMWVFDDAGIGCLRLFNIILMTTYADIRKYVPQMVSVSILGSSMTYWDIPIPNKAQDAISRDKLFTTLIDARFPGISL